MHYRAKHVNISLAQAWLAIPLTCVALLLSPSAPAAETADRPNIIVIMSDDMGYSDLGCFGSEIHTPNLDQLASNGLRFTQFYNTSRCCPTRASLLTGLYPHQAGVGWMTSDNQLDGYHGDLGATAVTMGEVMRTAGYGTYMVGKWHVTRFDRPDSDRHNWPLQRGFDRFYGTIMGGGSYYDPAMLTRDNTVVTPLTDAEYKPDSFYYTDAITDNAVQNIRKHSADSPDKPMFMYVAYTAAHWPMHAREEEIAKYRGKYSGGYQPIRETRYKRMQELGLIDSQWKLSPQAGAWDQVADKEWESRCMEVYAAMIDRMDQGIGRIVNALNETKRLDKTLIFFLQDNGGCAETVGRETQPKQVATPITPMRDDQLQTEVQPRQTRDGRPVRRGQGTMPGPADTYVAYGRGWANVSNTPFREYKHFVHEGGISTPLIAHWPSGIPRRGELERQPGHLIDIMATCVDVGGAKYPAEFNGHPITAMEGRSLRPAFRGDTISREAIYWEHEGNRAIRVGTWKLVAKFPTGKWELYDMSRDRTEMNDLAGAEPDRVKSMSEQWDAWAKRAHALPWPWKKPVYSE